MSTKDGNVCEAMLGVDSGMMAVVDPTIVDDFLASISNVLHGLEPMSGVYQVGAGGLLCATGGDGHFPVAIVVRDNAVTSFQITFDDQEARQDLWVAAGTVDVPSGTVLVGDPGFLLEYVPDPFEPPAEFYTVWSICQLPGPGRMDFSVIPDTTALAAIALRGQWQLQG